MLRRILERPLARSESRVLPLLFILLSSNHLPMASVAFKDKSKDKKKKKDKGNGKAISNEFVEDSGVDEPPSKAYKPPEGTTLLQNYLDTEDFDYDTLKDNDDLELWAIRVPEAVSLSMQVPTELPSLEITGQTQTLRECEDIPSIFFKLGSSRYAI